MRACTGSVRCLRAAASMLGSRQGLGEDVCEHVFGGAVFDVDAVGVDPVLDGIEFDVNVPGPRPRRGIFAPLD